MDGLDLKPTNPKDAFGGDKLPLHLWPTTASAMGSIALLEGACKYGRSNWREAGVRASIYVDACKRHLDAWFEGEDAAPDSGVPHLANALACLAILVDAQAAGKLTDDRAHNGSGYRALVDKLTPHVARLKALHADKAPKHYTIADTSRVGSLEAIPAQLMRSEFAMASGLADAMPLNTYLQPLPTLVEQAAAVQASPSFAKTCPTYQGFCNCPDGVCRADLELI